MAEQMPLILSVRKCERAGTSSEGWPIVECEVETREGHTALQLTSNAAHDLKGLLKDLPPRMTPAGKQRL